MYALRASIYLSKPFPETLTVLSSIQSILFGREDRKKPSTPEPRGVQRELKKLTSYGSNCTNIEEAISFR